MLYCLTVAAAAFQPALVTRPMGATRGAVPSMLQEVPDRRAVLQQGAAMGAAASLAPLLQPSAALAATDLGTWKQVDLPIVTEAPILFDIEFDPENPKNGWIVGNRGTFLQTTDSGKTWTPKSFANLDPDEEINYRFTKVSFKARHLPPAARHQSLFARLPLPPSSLPRTADCAPPSASSGKKPAPLRRASSKRAPLSDHPAPPQPQNGEGYIIGKPAILLHTKDSGNSWERVPLSPKLPGDPYSIVTLGPGKAEMTTSAGEWRG